MLHLKVSSKDFWDETKEEFIQSKECTLVLEHSLISISKWESKWCKTFLKTERTKEEEIDYIKCMSLTPITDDVCDFLNAHELEEINKYINHPNTALLFKKNKGVNNEAITSEVIYYWMICLNIPFECQKWHLNKLLALINLCNEKNNPKKRSSKEIMRDNAALNAKRKQQMKTKG